MRNSNPQLIIQIKKQALELLMHKNPEEIGMRDIASVCGITATNIYHYYKDKNELFQAVSLDCLLELNERIKTAVKEDSAKKAFQDETGTLISIKWKIKTAISVYRDWCFENPRRALLVMQGIKSATEASSEIIEEYYVCNRTGENLLKEAVMQGLAKSENPRLDIGILVSGLWGCIESVILKKSEIEYWENGKTFTDRFISMWIDSIFIR